jgi:PIN domain nuclease of toxin-antitoxin system
MMSSGPRTLKTFSVMARSSDSPPLLIDTHVWLWMVEGNPQLRPETQRIIDEAAANSRLRLSIMSIWEVAILAARGRIALSKSHPIWIRESLAEPGPGIEPLTAEIAMASCDLPGRFRSDPADEIIVATARVTGATLVTRDRRILDYAAAGHVNVVAA